MADEGGSYYSLPLLPHRSRFVGYLLLFLNLGSAYLFDPATKGSGRFLQRPLLTNNSCIQPLARVFQDASRRFEKGEVA